MTCTNAHKAPADPDAPPDFEAMRPTLVQALKDALRLRDCPEAECVAWHDQYERALDILEPQPALTCTPPGHAPG